MVANDIEQEFGYNSEEESIFHSFSQESESKLVHRHQRKITTNKEPKRCQKEVKDILRRVSLPAYHGFSFLKGPNATNF